ncbi:hypothetical protein, partial [Nocardia cyriacigeorgica]|uniref:hypothetical protein n=1 Tax=Nocardia cyriacigeorgica TaxID=135487 RepID=UPI00245726AE
IPARRMGDRLADIQREAAGLNSAMSTQMTERFSAPGATLVKLFGRPHNPPPPPPTSHGYPYPPPAGPRAGARGVSCPAGAGMSWLVGR